MDVTDQNTTTTPAPTRRRTKPLSIPNAARALGIDAPEVMRRIEAGELRGLQMVLLDCADPPLSKAPGELLRDRIEQILALDDLPAAQRMVLLVLAMNENYSTGLCCVPESRLARRAGMSPRTLRRCLRALVGKHDKRKHDKPSEAVEGGVSAPVADEVRRPALIEQVGKPYEGQSSVYRLKLGEPMTHATGVTPAKLTAVPDMKEQRTVIGSGTTDQRTPAKMAAISEDPVMPVNSAAVTEQPASSAVTETGYASWLQEHLADDEPEQIAS